MKDPIDGANYFFVDESGDPTFYDRNGNLIVGQPGCSPILILGFIEATEPTLMRRALTELHREIAADDYLKDVPSIAKTNVAFHAKDDTPEIREKVFKLIRTFDFKAQFVVARKIERVFRNTFQASERDFYDYLISLLFENVLHRYSRNRIYFSQRGSRMRQARLEEAIQQGINKFEARWKTRVSTEILVTPHTAVGEPCFQVIDYMNWAVYRAFVKQEMRYYRFVESKISLLVDRYDQLKYPKNWYNRDNPFDIEKASPL
ncbi:MAG: DUF3800 domain-containing protein [Chloroflexi bacterium]|nr:DUF3800 domain-containing protein [Chloroflexota bacterium]